MELNGNELIYLTATLGGQLIDGDVDMDDIPLVKHILLKIKEDSIKLHNKNGNK